MPVEPTPDFLPDDPDALEERARRAEDAGEFREAADFYDLCRQAALNNALYEDAYWSAERAGDCYAEVEDWDKAGEMFERGIWYRRYVTELPLRAEGHSDERIAQRLKRDSVLVGFQNALHTINARRAESTDDGLDTLDTGPN